MCCHPIYLGAPAGVGHTGERSTPEFVSTFYFFCSASFVFALRSCWTAVPSPRHLYSGRKASTPGLIALHTPRYYVGKTIPVHRNSNARPMPELLRRSQCEDNASGKNEERLGTTPSPVTETPFLQNCCTGKHGSSACDGIIPHTAVNIIRIVSLSLTAAARRVPSRTSRPPHHSRWAMWRCDAAGLCRLQTADSGSFFDCISSLPSPPGDRASFPAQPRSSSRGDGESAVAAARGATSDVTTPPSSAAAESRRPSAAWTIPIASWAAVDDTAVAAGAAVWAPATADRAACTADRAGDVTASCFTTISNEKMPTKWREQYWGGGLNFHGCVREVSVKIMCCVKCKSLQGLMFRNNGFIWEIGTHSGHTTSTHNQQRERKEHTDRPA